MEIDNLSQAITKALAYKENGGQPDVSNLQAGKTGEMKSIFQFTPDSWKRDAGEVLGNPNADLTPENEIHVVNEKVKGWIQKGYNARQIASMWNAGPGEPDAYKGQFSTGKASKGINEKYKQPYDVPKYADDVLNYAKKFYQEKTNQNQMQPTQQKGNVADVVKNALKQLSASKPVAKKKASSQVGLLKSFMTTKKA